MKNVNRRVAIVGSQRIPFVRSFKEYSRTSNQEMLTATIEALVAKFNLKGKLLGDVALGAVMANPIQWNLSREVVLGTSLDQRTPAFNVQRACGTSLETVNLIALKIAAGQIESGIGGGADTNSDLPILVKQSLAWKLVDLNNAKSFGDRLAKIFSMRPGDFKPAYPGIVEPRTGLSMGQHTEKMVKEWKITRLEQDQFAMTEPEPMAIPSMVVRSRRAAPAAWLRPRVDRARWHCSLAQPCSPRPFRVVVVAASSR